MHNPNRIYLIALTALGLLAAMSSGILFYLAGASTAGTVDTTLPDGTLPWVAVINFVYAIAIVITLCVRRFDPRTGRFCTRVLNWALLPAVPGGTVVGLYGLFWADKAGTDPTA